MSATGEEGETESSSGEEAESDDDEELLDIEKQAKALDSSR